MIEQNLKNFKLKSRATYQKLAEEEQALMAELSAAGDKFEAWANEPSSTPSTKRPPIGGRPPAIARAGGRVVAGSTRALSTNKRVGLAQRQQSAPRMEDGGEDGELEETPEVSKLNEIKAEMEQVDIDLMQNGGINCGWDANDHKDFLRIHT